MGKTQSPYPRCEKMPIAHSTTLFLSQGKKCHGILLLPILLKKYFESFKTSVQVTSQAHDCEEVLNMTSLLGQMLIVKNCFNSNKFLCI